MFVYESLPRRRSRAEWMIAPWSNAVGGRSSTGCQLVSSERTGRRRGGRGRGTRWRSPTRPGSGRGRRRSRPARGGHLGEVDLRREVSPDRRLERLVAASTPPGRAQAPEGVARPLPQQHLEDAVADLQHRGEGDLGRSGRLAQRFTTHSQKLAKGADDDNAKEPLSGWSQGSWRRLRSSPRAAGRASDAASGTTESTAQRESRWG